MSSRTKMALARFIQAVIPKSNRIVRKSAEKAVKDMLAHLRKHKIVFKMEVLFA